MTGPVKGLLAPGLMDQRGLLGMLYPQGWRGGLFGMGNPTGSYLDQMELSRPGVNPGASPVSNRDLARQYAVNMGSGMGTDAGGAANIGAGLLGTVKMYHGTPHTFDAFDLSKIGTGEGAQAYGHGLYFAENPGVAKSYMDSGVAPQHRANNYRAIQTSESNLKWCQDILDGKAQRPLTRNGKPVTDEWLNKEIADNRDVLTKAKAWGEKNRPNLYTVEHPADPEDFLHWDKSIKDQPGIAEKVRAAGFTVPDSKTAPGTTHGVSWMNNLENQVLEQGPKYGKSKAALAQEVSERLRAAGIPGIRYLDQGSRGSGEGTHNYVVFDDKPLKILSRE